MGSSDAEREAALGQCRDVDHRVDCLVDHERLIQEQLRTVRVSSFELDTFEVTVADYVAWLDRNPPTTIPVLPNVRREGEHFVVTEGRERLAVAGVTWNDARAYCEAIGKRLPTEAEWELAARGTERRTFPWGTTLPQCAQVIYERQEGQTCSMVGANDVAPIGSAPGDVTPQGVHDLGGNVSEWTADAAGDRPRCSGPCVDPRAEAHTKRVVRGGEWNGWGVWTRGATRSSVDPETSRTNLGFRCARTASPSS
jgi:formylglycine-generating enzyme required for sulfatase activity